MGPSRPAARWRMRKRGRGWRRRCCPRRRACGWSISTCLIARRPRVMRSSNSRRRSRRRRAAPAPGRRAADAATSPGQPHHLPCRSGVGRRRSAPAEDKIDVTVRACRFGCRDHAGRLSGRSRDARSPCPRENAAAGTWHAGRPPEPGAPMCVGRSAGTPRAGADCAPPAGSGCGPGRAAGFHGRWSDFAFGHRERNSGQIQGARRGNGLRQAAICLLWHEPNCAEHLKLAALRRVPGVFAPRLWRKLHRRSRNSSHETQLARTPLLCSFVGVLAVADGGQRRGRRVSTCSRRNSRAQAKLISAMRRRGAARSVWSEAQLYLD